MIIKFKKAQLKTLFILTLILLASVAIVRPIGVLLNTPVNGSWQNESSVNFVFTPFTNSTRGSAGVEIIDYCAIFSNVSGTNALLANITTNLQNGTPRSFGVAMLDTVGNENNSWNVSCANTTAIVWSETRVLGVDSNRPVITINNPPDNVYLSDNPDDASLRFTPVDPSNAQECSLWHNITGTWHLNATNTSFVSGFELDFNTSAEPLSAPNGTFIWNVQCNDSTDNSVWAEDTNRTFTVDTIFPTDINITFPKNNTISDDTTPFIQWNRTTENNFFRYEVTVSTNITNFNDGIFQTLLITDITDNQTNLSNIPQDNTYFILVTAEDLAGNQINSSTILTYTADNTAPIVELNIPTANNTFSANNTFDFNVTVTDANPDACELWLSNETRGNLALNRTELIPSSGTEFNLTATMADGNYTFYIECNDTVNNRVNATTSPYWITVDTVRPTGIRITSTWHQTNNTDSTPSLKWNQTNDVNFQRYHIQARYVSNNSIEYEANVTSITILSEVLSLTKDNTYNFTVTAYDLAGNSNQTGNTTDTWYYVDELCSTLEAGWNLCGATWVTPKNLSVIGSETAATFVTVWNKTHEWATCIFGVSGTNCDINTAVNNSEIGHVWVYVDTQTEWRNRTWVTTQAKANITLTNITNGWNIIPGEFRNGRNFGDLSREFTSSNVSMFSLPFINGSVASLINKGAFREMAVNTTTFNFGKAMWVFYNGTASLGNNSNNHTFDVGSW